jgi:predicted AAA+ superfamily ATPase
MHSFSARTAHCGSYCEGENRQPYFWQDNHGKEIDCLLVEGERTIPIEIKSGKTVSLI